MNIKLFNNVNMRMKASPFFLGRSLVCDASVNSLGTVYFKNYRNILTSYGFEAYCYNYFMFFIVL